MSVRCRHRLWLAGCRSCRVRASAVAYLEELGAQVRRRAAETHLREVLNERRGAA